MTLSPHKNLGDALRHHAALTPDAIALSFPQTGQQISFARWLTEAERLAKGLLALGLRPGDPVALLAQNRVEWPVIEFACALAGVIFVPLNTHLRREDLHYVLKHSRSKALFLSNRFRSQRYLATVGSLRKDLPDLTHLISLDNPEGDVIDQRKLTGSADLPNPEPESTGSLLYTSGTTGFPKGALLSHRAMLFDASRVNRRLRIGSHDRWTSIIPLFHCAGCIMNVLGSLLAGARYVGIDAFDPVAMFQVIQGERCTVLSGVPTSYFAMLKHPERKRYDLSSLRTGTCGGADANPELLKRCATEFPIPQLCNVYGQTESATIIACPDCDDPERFATVGPPLEGCEVRITHTQTGVRRPVNAIGQIEARGPLVMTGYLNDETATREVIDEAGWLKTGDLGRLTPSGKLQLAGGRLRDMVIRGGENIYPVEIENCLLEHDRVKQTAVFGLPDEYYGEIVAAAVDLEDGTDIGELGAYCKERLAHYKIPSVWFAVSDFPLTASGKVRKVALRTMASEQKLKRLHPGSG